MPRRSCVACREQRPTTALVHLGLEDGEVHLTPRGAHGRGAWVCARTACIEALCSRRDLASRAFRCKASVPAALPEQIRRHEWRLVSDAIHACARQGLCRNPSSIADLTTPSPLLCLVSTQCAPELYQQLKQAWPGAVQYRIDFTADSENPSISPNSSGIIGISAGRSAQRLHIHLQRWVDMG